MSRYFIFVGEKWLLVDLSRFRGHDSADFVIPAFERESPDSPKTVSKNFREIYTFYPWNVSKKMLSLALSKQGVKTMYCILAALLIKSFKKYAKRA